MLAWTALYSQILGGKWPGVAADHKVHCGVFYLYVCIYLHYSLDHPYLHQNIHCKIQNVTHCLHVCGKIMSVHVIMICLLGFAISFEIILAVRLAWLSTNSVGK